MIEVKTRKNLSLRTEKSVKFINEYKFNSKGGENINLEKWSPFWHLDFFIANNIISHQDIIEFLISFNSNTRLLT
jgi:hypothetical protein